jgi:polysaccharide export outer membrane protein
MKDLLHTFYLGLIALLFCAAASAQTSYQMGPGDEIRLTVYGQPDLTTESQISGDGTVEIPLLGPIQIAGRTTAEASRFIADYYIRAKLLQDAHVNILITEYRSQSVSILGKVNTPGKVVLDGPLSLTEALASAGGVAETGSERLILVRTNAEGKQERQEFDLQQLLNHQADDSPIVWLKDGDTLYVPVAGRFYVSGEVRSPGMYPLDRGLSVMQALGVGGGLTPRASDRALKLFRKQPNGSVKELRAKPDDQVLDGDVLVVGESLF